MSSVHKPQPPKGDHPESWRVDILAFNYQFTEVLFEGYSKDQVENWVKREIIDTAQINNFNRIGLEAADPDSDPASKVDLIKGLIHEKLTIYTAHISELEALVLQAEQQAELFEDQAKYNDARKRDISRFKVLKAELEDIISANIFIEA